MKEITLKKLVLSNWRGQNHEIVFNDDATRISGINGAGKTSIMASWYWLLSSMTEPHNPKNYNLFDNRVELTHETPLAKVKAWVKIGDYDYTIEKTAEAKFSRPKGSSEWVKASSDTYTVYIDEIETSATQFNEWINANICPVAMLPYCLSGDFFSYLASEDKNKARTMLKNLCGEINAEDFKGDYSSIEELLKRYSASDIVEMSRKKKKPLEERQNVIPVEIDRKEERLVELKAMDFTATESEIEKIKAEIEAIDGLLLGNADAIKPILDHNREIENELANLRRILLDSRAEYEAEQRGRTLVIKAKIDEIKRYNEGVDKENKKRKDAFSNSALNATLLLDEIKSLENYLNTLRGKKHEVKNRVFTEDHCPYCGAELDPLEIEGKRIDFNNNKQRELEMIVAEGKATKEKLERKQKEYAELAEQNEGGPTLLEKSSTEEFEEALKRVEDSFVPFEDTNEYACLMLEIDALAKEIKEIPSNDNEALTSEKKALIEHLSELSKKLGLKDEITKVEKGIDELRSELRSVANAIAELEKLIYTSKQWEDERNNIVSYKINHELESSKIEMFSTLKNGETMSDCVVLNKRGVRMGSTNFSDRILIEIDMQMLFMRKMGVRLPIWIDESAVFSSSNLPHREGYQMIFMFPSDSPRLEIS